MTPRQLAEARAGAGLIIRRLVLGMPELSEADLDLLGFEPQLSDPPEFDGTDRLPDWVYQMPVEDGA